MRRAAQAFMVVAFVLFLCAGLALASTSSLGVKTKGTYWTTERKEQFKVANFANRFSYLSKADSYLDKGLDYLWSFVPSQKVPRACEVVAGGRDWEPVLNQPWKLTDGIIVMPTNDFAAYYQSGLDEFGFFQPGLADKGLLKNELYPEKGEKWGVDDGYGWVDENGVHHAFIAYYNHYFVWYEIRDMVEAFRNAFLMTGEQQYATAGLVMLDRIADVYPDMDLAALGNGFYNSHGGTGEGKIVGSIWETGLVRSLISSYDAFFPELFLEKNKELIEFLEAKAEQYNLGPLKKSFAGVRKNIEEGIVRQVLPAVKKAQIRGNFGMHEATLAMAAVVLDEPEGYTKDALDFLFQPGGLERAGNGWQMTGLNLLGLLVGNVDRDGHGHEASPEYNRLHVGTLGILVDILEGYDGYTGVDIATHPKYLKMQEAQSDLIMLNRYIPSIGDSGSTGAPSGSLKGASDSVNLAGYGFAALREGSDPEDKRGVWLYYGRNSGGHGHKDALNIDFYGFGLDLSPDLGYPELASAWPHRDNFSSNTTSHNLVLVDRERQRSQWVSVPRHYDVTEVVKLIDVEAPLVYPQTDLYRRTLAMINVGKENSYYVDFFRVKGGSDHHYLFHGAKGNVTTHGLKLEAQATGTYAGPEVPFADPQYNHLNGNSYNDGFNYLYDVERQSSPEKVFSVDWAIEDHWGVTLGKGAHLRLTMVGNVDDVAIAYGNPPYINREDNPKELRYLVAHRSGEGLASLFSAVIQPYKNDPFITAVEPVEIRPLSGGKDLGDARALRIDLPNGRIDYVVHSLDPSITYQVDRKFLFRGFFGLYTEIFGFPIYGYVNEGSLLGREEEPLIAESAAKLTGTVVDFTKDMSIANKILVQIDPAETQVPLLTGRYIYIENDGERNAAYEIKSVTHEKGLLRLDIGDTTLVRELASEEGLGTGFKYNIAAGNCFAIPLSKEVQVAQTQIVVKSPSAQEPVHGLVPLEVFVDTAGRQLNGVTIKVDGNLFYTGTKVPANLAINTHGLSEGEHYLMVKTSTFEGEKAVYNASFTVENWWEIKDQLEAPVVTGWFGVMDFSKTVDKSSGWGYDEGTAQEFLGDKNRMYRKGNTAEYLTWKADGLAAFEVTLYTQQSLVEGSVHLSVSEDGSEWITLDYEVDQQEQSSGWYQYVLRGRAPKAPTVSLFRLTLRESAQASKDLQVGLVLLRGQKTAEAVPK